MFKVETDKRRNLLIMSFSQHVGPEELERWAGEVKALLADLHPKFRLLSDLTNLDSMDPACLPYIRANMDLLNKQGVSEVVRVIPDPHKDIGLNILSLFHYRRGIKIVTCETMAEALEALA